MITVFAIVGGCLYPPTDHAGSRVTGRVEREFGESHTEYSDLSI